MSRIHVGHQGTFGTRAEVRALVADVDGTLVNSDKQLTERTIAVVHELAVRDIPIMLTSGRPPRGMQMLIEPLGLTTPLAAFNGGMFIRPDLTVIERHLVDDELVGPVCETLAGHGLDVWAYTDSDWFVGDLDGPHVARETATVGFGPDVNQHIEQMHGVVKLVGVNDDESLIEEAARAMDRVYGDGVVANPSQPYYLDVTHPLANKGTVVRFLSDLLRVDTGHIATIGDMPNDMMMFEVGGLAIAMGNGEEIVKEHADFVTGSNDDDGFADAVERYVLRSAVTTT
jgi:Cof subfamily protein (haloacid dehalogenase superfamily)